MSRGRRPKKRLGHLADHRARLSERTAGRGVLRVALVGYTNAGKSTATSLG
jgi:50S ribosomal subunit-associated GTPase HflX